MLKYSSDGDLDWKRTWGGDVSAEGPGITLGELNNFYMTLKIFFKIRTKFTITVTIVRVGVHHSFSSHFVTLGIVYQAC